MHPTTATSLYVIFAAVSTTCFFSDSVVSSSHGLQINLTPPHDVTSGGPCLPRERDALLAFKQGITADPSGLLSTWQPGVDCCMWEGIQCAKPTGHVIKLHRHNPDDAYDDEERKEYCLAGPIGRSLFALRHLRELGLRQNCLEGPVSSEIGRIPSGAQLDTLYSENPEMYNGNGGLCGYPLRKNCPSYHVLPQGHPRTTAQFAKMELFYKGLALGFIAGSWVVFCTMLFKKAWRVAYFRLFDDLYDNAYVLIVVGWARLTRNTTAI